jgi:hypothetical protein
MARGSFTPQQVQRHGGQAQLFNFDATSCISLGFYDRLELPLSQFQFPQSLSQFPRRPKAAFCNPLRAIRA